MRARFGAGHVETREKLIRSEVSDREAASTTTIRAFLLFAKEIYRGQLRHDGKVAAAKEVLNWCEKKC